MVETTIERFHKGPVGVVTGARDELRDMIRDAPRSRPVASYTALAILFLLTGFVFVTLGLLDLVAFAFRGNSYAWILVFAIVGAVWFAIGSVFAIAAALNERPSSSKKAEGDELRSAA
jgi:hypothetical protein